MSEEAVKLLFDIFLQRKRFHSEGVLIWVKK